MFVYHYRKKKINQSVFTSEELDQLDLAGLPEPKTKEQLDEIMRLFHVAVHERDVVCCVCDQFLRISESQLVPSASLPTAFLFKLQPPMGKYGQCNVSEFFPNKINQFARAG